MTDVRAITAHPTGVGLAELLKRQHALYRQLRDMSDQQRAALEEGSTQELLAVLGRRQTVVDELTEVAGGLSAVGDRWAQLTAELSEDQRTELQALTREVQQLAEEVMARDEADQSELRGMKQRTGEQMRSMHAGRAAAAAYQSGNARPAGSATPAATSPYGRANPQQPRFADRNA